MYLIRSVSRHALLWAMFVRWGEMALIVSFNNNKCKMNWIALWDFSKLVIYMSVSFNHNEFISRFIYVVYADGLVERGTQLFHHLAVLICCTFIMYVLIKTGHVFFSNFPSSMMQLHWNWEALRQSAQLCPILQSLWCNCLGLPTRLFVLLIINRIISNIWTSNPKTTTIFFIM